VVSRRRRTVVPAALLVLMALTYVLVFRWEWLMLADLRAGHDPRTGQLRAVASAFPWLSPAWVGAALSLALLACALVAQAFSTGGKRNAIHASAAIAGCVITGEALKWGLGALTPLGGGTEHAVSASFPSVHAAAATAVAIALARLTSSRSLLVAAAYPMMMGIFVVLVGFHYPSDVVGGCLLGAAWAVAVPHEGVASYSAGAVVGCLGAMLSMCALLVAYSVDFGRAGVAVQAFGVSSLAIAFAATGAAVLAWWAGGATNPRPSSGVARRTWR
jgi:membrane-associated phospholipid phosphatase